ncbi:hypothetical protein KP696_20875 [Nocardia seriolae]|nr:hypothetical protein [Nocardia seriolae]MTJ74395.1 hypothetical protein [Nocardia seriolae]MTJ90718.1 hypothetical protein [Nocardia seriolae]MTK34677.1 hypothetical protein [Nocardia seriolae]MTK39135.1 hypothetical protein [Nocardia seriolae]
MVSLLSAPANAAPADPGAVPADQQQPEGTQPADTPTPDPKVQVVPAPKPENVQPGTTKPQGNQPGVTTPTTPNNPAPDNGAKPDQGQPQGGQPDATPKPDPTAPKNDPNAQPAGTNPQPGQPKSLKPSQPGVTVPRVAPLPVPGQPNQVQPAVTEPTPDQSTTPGQQNQPKPNDQTAQPAGTTPKPNDNAVDTVTGQPSGTTPQQPRWQSPAVDTAPAAPVVAMTGPHTEIGVNLDGGAVLPGWAANTHHFSNLDGYVGTIGYTTPGGIGEAGMSLDFTTVNQIKVTTFAGSGPDNDQKIEFVLDTAAANAAKASAESFIRLMPGGAIVLEAAAQIGKLPEGDRPSQSVDVGGVTAQVGGSVQY